MLCYYSNEGDNAAASEQVGFKPYKKETFKIQGFSHSLKIIE